MHLPYGFEVKACGILRPEATANANSENIDKSDVFHNESFKHQKRKAVVSVSFEIELLLESGGDKGESGLGAATDANSPGLWSVMMKCQELALPQVKENQASNATTETQKNNSNRGKATDKRKQ